MALMESLFIVAGALISGIIGLFAEEYRFRREQYAREQQWYSRTRRLAQRVVSQTRDEYTPAQARVARSTCAGVHSMLAEHLGEAPASIDEEVLDLTERLVTESQIVMDMMSPHEAQQNPDEMIGRMATASETAEQVNQIVRSKQEEDGWV